MSRLRCLLRGHACAGLLVAASKICVHTYVLTTFWVCCRLCSHDFVHACWYAHMCPLRCATARADPIAGMSLWVVVSKIILTTTTVWSTRPSRSLGSWARVRFVPSPTNYLASMLRCQWLHQWIRLSYLIETLIFETKAVRTSRQQIMFFVVIGRGLTHIFLIWFFALHKNLYKVG